MSEGIYTEKLTVSMYSCENQKVDGLQFRSYASMVQHGAPNTRFYDIASILGNFVIMRAIDSIASGEQVCVSYGSKYFAHRNIIPLETRPKAREYMKKNPSIDPEVALIQSKYLLIPASFISEGQ